MKLPKVTSQVLVHQTTVPVTLITFLDGDDKSLLSMRRVGGAITSYKQVVVNHKFNGSPNIACYKPHETKTSLVIWLEHQLGV